MIADKPLRTAPFRICRTPDGDINGPRQGEMVTLSVGDGEFPVTTTGTGKNGNYSGCLDDGSPIEFEKRHIFSLN